MAQLIPIFYESIKLDERKKYLRWLSRNLHIQGIGGFSGAKAYMWYVESLENPYNAIDGDFLRRHQIC
jgi:hypothetical protein